MIRLVSELLQNAANAMPESFPMSELKLPRIRQLIRLIKVVASVPSQLEPAALKPYSLATADAGTWHPDDGRFKLGWDAGYHFD